MKFIYIDESGKVNSSPFAVLCGISYDHNRMRKTKETWLAFIEWLNGQGVKTSELHTAQFFAGNGVWYKLNGNKRKAIIRAIINWMNERSHEFCVVAANKKDFEKTKKETDLWTSNLWSFLATHLLFAFSKRYQKEKGVKGDFVAIFDNGCIGSEFNNFILSNKADKLFIDYVGKEAKIKLSDAPFCADSKHSSLIQISDFVVFFARRKIELESGLSEKYKNEQRDINSFYETLQKSAIQKRFVYKQNSRSEIEELFFSLAPNFLKK